MPSINRRILTATVMVGAMNGLVMVVAVMRDLIFAYRFGTGEIVDAFLMGLLVPTMAVQLIGVSLGLAMVPEIIQLRSRNDRAEADALSSSAAIVGLGVLVAISAVLLVFFRPITALLSVGFDAERTRLTGVFLLGLLPCIVLQGWSALLGGLLNATGRFAIAALAPAFRALALCCVLAVDWGAYSAEAMLGGYLVGALAEAALMTVAASRAKISIWPRWSGLTPSLRTVLHEFAMVVVGTGILNMAVLTDQYLASLAGAGAVAAYGYGGKIITVLTGLGGMSLGVAVLPYFAAQAREGQWGQLRGVLIHWGAIILALSIPATGLLWFCSADLVRLAFQRGAFSPGDTRLVASIQMYLALQLPFYLCGILCVRVLISMQRNALVALVALVNAVTNVSLSLILLKTLGVEGIALGASGGYVMATLLSGLLSFWLLRRNLRSRRADVHWEAAARPDQSGFLSM
jgi:putative peptidoglycan lipid II flippase